MTTFFDERPPNAPFEAIMRRDAFRRVFRVRDASWASALRAVPLRRGERILDVGGASGILLDRMSALRGTRGVCVDLALRGLREARARSRAVPVCASATALPFPDGIFAAAFSFETLEHIPRYAAAVAELVRVTRPGGSIVVSAVSARWQFTWDWWLSRAGIDVFSRAGHDPKLFIDPDGLEAAFRAGGAEVRERHYLNAFATLAFDEAVMIAALGLDRLPRPAAHAALLVLTALRVLVGPVLRLSEIPWRSRRRSNSILFVAERPAGPPQSASTSANTAAQRST